MARREVAESFGHDVMAYLRARGARRGLAAKDEASLLCSAAHEGWEAGLRELIFGMITRLVRGGLSEFAGAVEICNAQVSV